MAPLPPRGKPLKPAHVALIKLLAAAGAVKEFLDEAQRDEDAEPDGCPLDEAQRNGADRYDR